MTLLNRASPLSRSIPRRLAAWSRGGRTLIAAIMLGALPSVSFAAVLFSNFPDPLYGGNYVGTPGKGSQEFTLASASTITSMSISDWTTGTPTTTMDWVISTAAHGTGSILASGTSSVSNVFFANFSGYNVYTSTFALPGVSLAGGDYFVTLQGNNIDAYNYWGVTPVTGHDSWTSSNGVDWVDTSNFYENLLIVAGNDAVVPAPATLVLLGLGLAGLGFSRRKKA